MIYAIADLHGYPIEKLKALLKNARFCDKDFLYFLGDVIDRNGDGGVELLYWMMNQPNVQMILGNHEATLLSCAFVFDKITEESVNNLSAEKLDLLNTYLINGGDVTLKAMKALDFDTRDWLLEYLREAPLYEAVTAGDTDYLLVHSGLGNFSKEKRISNYSPNDLLWTRPELEDCYYDDIMTVFGHTPTFSYGEEYRGKILRTRTWINIDVGAAYGEEPVMLRLDDGKEFVLPS